MSLSQPTDESEVHICGTTIKLALPRGAHIKKSAIHNVASCADEMMHCTISAIAIASWMSI